MPKLKARRAGAWLRYHIGRRGAFLLFLALLDIIYFIGLINPTPRSASQPSTIFVEKIAPLYTWAVIWLAVGICCLITAFLKKDGWGFAGAIFIKVLWGTVLFLGWLMGDVERGYLSMAIWGSFALIILLISSWPEPIQHTPATDTADAWRAE